MLRPQLACHLWHSADSLRIRLFMACSINVPEVVKTINELLHSARKNYLNL